MKCFSTVITSQKEQEKKKYCKTFFRNYNKTAKRKMENIKHEMKISPPQSF